jgi:hypothetical protein
VAQVSSEESSEEDEPPARKSHAKGKYGRKARGKQTPKSSDSESDDARRGSKGGHKKRHSRGAIVVDDETSDTESGHDEEEKRMKARKVKLDVIPKRAKAGGKAAAKEGKAGKSVMSKTGKSGKVPKKGKGRRATPVADDDLGAGREKGDRGDKDEDRSKGEEEAQGDEANAEVHKSRGEEEVPIDNPGGTASKTQTQSEMHDRTHNDEVAFEPASPRLPALPSPPPPPEDSRKRKPDLTVPEGGCSKRLQRQTREAEEWAVETRNFLLGFAKGKVWGDLVDAWFAFETTGFDKLSRVSEVSTRPHELRKWLQGQKVSMPGSFGPVLENVEDYKERWMAWWDDLTVGGAGKTTARATIRKAGPLGVVTILLGLAFWSEGRAKNAEWRQVVGELQGILKAE